MDDVDAEAWRVFASCRKRVVVTALPRVMVEWFAREHLGDGVVVGAELVITRHGRAMGLLMRQEDSVADRVQALFEAGHRPRVGLGRPSPTPSFLSLCKEQRHPPFTACSSLHSNQATPSPLVIFHDGRLVRRPTPATALLTLPWMPFGVPLA
ncbi:hypothetical protein Taro_003569 [Colocasia esculenta]|uniref:Glycerol-3-phosphate acyltransferase RAM2/GPAT1-8 HAD-like domain-containing protein n=1 Tax=Colocasia esculenta TaxID=4460 RepID=A0A843TK31_COLES|nr:hypothetical protein [Colocasia esculenta]